MRTRRDPLEELPVAKKQDGPAYHIMLSIINSGGLYASAAKYYLGDDQLSRLFITECFEQCHHQSATELWGENLILEMTRFRLQILRDELRSLQEQLHGNTQRKPEPDTSPVNGC